MTSTAMGTNQTIQDIHRAGPTSIFKAYNGLYGFYGRHMGQLEAGGRTKNVSNQLTAKISAGVEPVKGLKIQGSFATVYFNSRNDQFVAPIYTVGDLYGDVQNKVASFIEIKNSTTLSTTTELTASYKSASTGMIFRYSSVLRNTGGAMNGRWHAATICPRSPRR